MNEGKISKIMFKLKEKQEEVGRIRNRKMSSLLRKVKNFHSEVNRKGV